MGGLETIFRLSVIVNMIDNLTSTSRQVNTSINNTNQSVNNMQQQYASMAKTGAIVAAAGAEITKAVLSPVEATFDTKKALGELASLGITSFKEMEDAATQFSNTWAGTSKAEFISAAYDIKSGISTLSDAGVAGYTEVAGLTAKATKATVGEMTSLFATGYGIYKDFYSDLSDIEFAELFSAGISQSVKQFKTTGPQMAQSIQTLGASATNANVPLEEQLTILGMLQQTMPGGEAGTKYRAFLKSAGKAGEELGVSFMDANKQLLSMPEILAKIKGKYGETLDAVEKLELQKAFGTEEAVALIDLMYAKTDMLEGNIIQMHGTLGEGTKIATEMAEAMNQDPGQRYILLQQQFQNLKETLGEQLLPTVIAFMETASGWIGKISAWASENEQLVSVLMHLALGLGILTTLVGTLMVVYGMGGMVIAKGLPIMSKAIGLLRTIGVVVGKVVVSIFKMSAALLANPITWVVIGIVALIAALYLLWKNWDTVSAVMTNVFGGAVEATKGFIDGLVTAISSGINRALDWVNEKILSFRESGSKIMNTLAEGIKSAAMAPVEAVKGAFGKVRNLLPFSDAKEGPLSNLTLNGRKVIETIGLGMNMSAPILATTAGLAFEGMMDNVGSLKQERPKGLNIREVFSKERSERSRETQIREKDGNVTINKLVLKVEKLDRLEDLFRLIKELEDVDNSNEDE